MTISPHSLAADAVRDIASSIEPLVSISNLMKRYRTLDSGEVQALYDVNLTIDRGSFVVVVGPSGCGKSTLLRILAGILDRSSGSVRMAERTIDGPSRAFGVVFQAPVLLPWRTVLQNTLVPSEIQKLDPSAARARAQGLLAMMGLSEFEEKYPSELSGGMQQRVGICRALVHEPSILLMDEPFGALDAMTRETMNLELLRIWSKQRITIVLVTHSIAEAVFLADKVVVMTPRPGRIAEIIDINLSRPRRLEMFNTAEFGNYVSAVRRHFRSEGRLD
jgi:NitT/TauT family transport system ATP-binding protein